MEIEKIAAAVEAILFVAGDPVERQDIERALEISDVELSAAVEKLEAELDFNLRGLKLIQFSDKLQLCSRPDYADYVERVLSPIQKQSLSGTLLETLSVIAYKQPITKQDVENVRGVRCDYSVAVLTKLRLIAEVGRKESLGRPILYGTTDEFLRHFGLSTIDELPKLNLGEPSQEFTEAL
ncbi:MAG: SMC-Scp complex subunit ScpB [Christensenellales bacterium]